MVNTYLESSFMLSDKLIKRLDESIDDYALSKLDENDKNIVIDKIDNLDKEIQRKIARFTIDEKDSILEEYGKCKTLKEFQETQRKDENRRFLFELYTALIGNMSIEEVEKKYCSKKKKDLK